MTARLPVGSLLVGAAGVIVLVVPAAARTAWLGLALLVSGAVGLVLGCLRGRRRSLLFAALLALGALAAGAGLALETLEWCSGSLGCDPGDSSDTLDAAALGTLGVGLALIPAASVAFVVGRRNA